MAYTPVAAKAKAAVGTKIEIKGTGSTYTAIGGDVTSIQIPSPSFDKIEVTHLLSAAKEYLGGMKDNGTLAIKMNYVPNSTEHKALLAALGKVNTYKITFDITPTVACEFAALATGFPSDASGPNDVFSGTLNLDVSGDVTWTP